MKNNIQQFCFPASVPEALRLMAKLKAKAVVVAGGTRHTRSIAPQVETVVDISDLPLKFIKADRSGLRIGALCTISDLEKSPLLAGWAGGVIAQTAGLSSNALARGMGTVGGNVCRAHPYNHMPPVFLALDAAAVYSEGGREKSVPFARLLEPGFMRELGHRCLLTELRVPAATKSWSGATARFALTPSQWESTAHCVAALDLQGGTVRRAALAAAALLPRAARLPKAEAALTGKPVSEETAWAASKAAVFELEELTGRAAAKAYACEVAGVLLRRTILEACHG
ncbi:MAG: FAD binding domain-containing protein [Elusimicrobia bacterium]|nr:FAD binding domain-containing protein [Elusimicrobiota bacterium]